jgi:ABC-type branched-subunit amino acid transport system substrate-binding protein
MWEKNKITRILFFIIFLTQSLFILYAVDAQQNIKIGVISPLDELFPYYQEILSITFEDINQYCYENSLPYEFEFVHEFDISSSAVALEKLQGFKALDINLILDNLDDYYIQAGLSYINDNDMLLFSSRSSLPFLTIDDNLFRLTSNLKVQADVTTKLYNELGTKAIIILYDTDSYGELYKNLIKKECNRKNIQILGEFATWNPESSELYNLGTSINSLITLSELKPCEIGFQIISKKNRIDTFLDLIINQDYPNFQKAIWYGDEYTTLYIENLSTLIQYLKNYKIYGIKKAPAYSNPRYIDVNNRFYSFTSTDLDYYYSTCYDILWILAKSIINMDSCDANLVLQEYFNIAQSYRGISGIISLDTNGDRVLDDFDIWSIYEFSNGGCQFIRSGYYDQITNEITLLWQKIYPHMGQANSEYCLSGGGFTPGGNWTMIFGDPINPYNIQPSNDVFEDGTYLEFFSVPNVPEGHYHIYAIDDTTGKGDINCFEVIEPEKTPYLPPISIMEHPRRSNIILEDKKIYPVQSAWEPDYNNNGIIDVASNKPIAIIVKAPIYTNPFNKVIRIEITFQGKTYTLKKPTMYGETPSLFTYSSIYEPIIPTNTGFFNITGKMFFPFGFPQTLINRTVEVHNIPDHKITYHYMEHPEYGKVTKNEYDKMVKNSNIFLNATYPAVINSTNNYNNLYTKITGKNSNGPNVGYNWDNSVLLDCQHIATNSSLAWNGAGSTVGVGIAPSSSTTDYFVYHGEPDYAGISYGDDCKGVICLEDYYVSVAHECGHLKNLYYNIDEQYEYVPPNGILTSGVWVDKSEWRTGFDIMGTTPKSSFKAWILGSIPVCNQCPPESSGSMGTPCPITYNVLFSKLQDENYDPEIFLANGIIYKNGTADMEPQMQYRLPEGYPHAISPGNFALQFLNEEGQLLSNTTFSADFVMHIEPKTEVYNKEDKFGKIEINYSPFSFATIYPKDTFIVNLVNLESPSRPLASISASSINERLHADTGGPYHVYIGEEVILDARKSYSPYGDISKYEWDLNNDGRFTDSSGITTNYTWNFTGNYLIGLKVSDEKGRIDIDTNLVEVKTSNRSRLKILEEKTSQLIEENDKLKKENEEIIAEIRELENKVNTLQEEVANLKEDNNNLQTYINKLYVIIIIDFLIIALLISRHYLKLF